MKVPVLQQHACGARYFCALLLPCDFFDARLRRRRRRDGAVLLLGVRPNGVGSRDDRLGHLCAPQRTTTNPDRVLLQARRQHVLRETMHRTPQLHQRGLHAGRLADALVVRSEAVEHRAQRHKRLPQRLLAASARLDDLAKATAHFVQQLVFLCGLHVQALRAQAKAEVIDALLRGDHLRFARVELEP